MEFSWRKISQILCNREKQYSSFINVRGNVCMYYHSCVTWIICVDSVVALFMVCIINCWIKVRKFIHKCFARAFQNIWSTSNVTLHEDEEIRILLMNTSHKLDVSKNSMFYNCNLCKHFSFIISTHRSNFFKTLTFICSISFFLFFSFYYY